MYKKQMVGDPNLVTDIMINLVDGGPFLYKLVGTWAHSPHPKHWREMLDWFNSIDHEKFDPYVPGMITSDWLHMHTSMGKRHMTWVRKGTKISISIHKNLLMKHKWMEHINF